MTTTPELRAQLTGALDRAETLVSTAEAEGRDLTDDERTEHAELVRRAEQLGPELRRAEQLDRIRAAAMHGHTEAGAYGDNPEPPRRAIQTRDAALVALDRADHAPDHARHLAASLIDRAQGLERDTLSQWVRTTISPAYESACRKLFCDPNFGHRAFDAEELAAYQQGQALQRALNLGSGQNGAFLVPFTLDPSINLSSGGSVNPLRAISRVVTTATNAWAGITSAGVSASWDAEAAQVSDDSPQFLQPEITVHKGAAYVQASLEVAQDSSIGQQLGPLFVDAKDQLEATAFTTGSGSGQPKGVITAVAAVGGSVVTSAGSALSVADVVANQNALPPRWRPRARWMANLSIINQGRQLAVGSGLTTPLVVDGGNGPSMMGWPVHENSVMDGTIAAGTTNDYVLLSGDFNNFLIVDRIGLSVAFQPLVVGANFRPTGEVGWYATWRTGSDVINADAFRLTNYNA